MQKNDRVKLIAASIFGGSFFSFTAPCSTAADHFIVLIASCCFFLIPLLYCIVDRRVEIASAK